MALYPQSPAFRTVSADLQFDTDISTSNNGREQAASIGGAPVVIQTKYNDLTFQEARAIKSFLVAHQGQAKAFDLKLPVESETFGDITGSTPRASATVNTGHQIPLKDLKPSTTVRYAGDFIQFAGHDKAYMLISDLASDASGFAYANIQPSLYDPVTLNEQVIIDEVVFRVRATSDLLKTTLKPGLSYSFSVNFVESIR